MTEVPFVAQDAEHTARLNTGRIVEAIIIAVLVSALTAAASSAWTVGAVRIELSGLTKQVAENKVETEKSVNELKTEVRDLRNAIFVPRWQDGQQRPVIVQPAQPEQRQ